MLLTLSVGVLGANEPDYPATDIYDDYFLLDEDDRYVGFNEPVGDSVPYGETIYYPLLSKLDSGYAAVHESDATRSMTVRTKWNEGSSYVDKISVIKKRYTGTLSGVQFPDDRYCYFLAIKTKSRSSTTTAAHEVSGIVTLRKSRYDDVELDVDFEVGYNAPEDANVIPITPALFVPGVDFDEYDDETFEFEADSYSYLVVNTNSQRRLVLGMNTDYDDDIGNKYPDANLYFFNGNGGSFNRIGYLYLYADRGSYVYEIDSKNVLERIKATYDSYDEAYIIRTRTLGRYVISDTKLNVAEKNPDEDEDTSVIYDNDTGTNHNPGTGGFGFDHLAYGTPASAVTEQSPSAAPTPAITGSSTLAEAPDDTVKQAQPKEDGPTVIGTAKKLDNTLAPPAAKAAVSADNAAASTNNYRRLVMIVCGAGAVLSAIGLIICGLVSFNRSRAKYY